MRNNKDDKRKLWVRIVAAVLAIIFIFGIVISSIRVSAFDTETLSDKEFSNEVK